MSRWARGIDPSRTEPRPALPHALPMDLAGRRILMLAPEPVVRPRGTPLSVLARLRALSELGCKVDLLTYPFGEAVRLRGVRVERCSPGPVRREPPVGPSPAKMVLDLHLARRARKTLLRRRYHLIHTHEEAAVIGAWLAQRHRLPHLYEMHSSLPEQMVTYGWFRPGGIGERLGRRVERWVLRHSDAVLVVCPALRELVEERAPATPVFLVENPPLTYVLGIERPPEVAPSKGMILYAGNLAANQGIDLLLEAMVRVSRAAAEARLVVIGGRPAGVERARQMAERLGLGGCVEFRGIRSLEETLAAHCSAAVLVSPRTAGRGVPSKVYTYLAAGRPIVATDIPAHTQVLDRECALLVPPTAEGLARGLVQVLGDEALAARLAAGARRYLALRFSPAEYRRGVHAALAAALEAGERRRPAVVR